MAQLSIHEGETVFSSMSHVEDKKGNNGDKGSMLITNLRLIWFCDKDKFINLSIGYDCVLNNDLKDVNSIHGS
jgi:Bardet-Biedl syndrome 5 protein